MDKALIAELQDHFDGRGKLKKVANAIKCYTKDTSIFFSYIDGWGKKQYINIPIEPSEILPILEKYINNIDADIVRISSSTKQAVIDNLADIESYISDYKQRYPETYTSLETIISTLTQVYQTRKQDGSGDNAYHIPVCSDWQDKLFTFSLIGECGETVYFQYEGIYKL